MRWAGHVAHMGEERKMYRISVGKSEGKTPLERPRCRLVDGIRLDLRDIFWVSVKWIQLDQERGWWWALVNIVMDLSVLTLQSESAIKYFQKHNQELNFWSPM
jgi:hypothetical protein